MPASEPAPPSRGTILEVFLTFLKLGLTSFGGPIAHLGYFRKELVERRGWISESHYGQLLALCQFLPGPASSQLGFTLGRWRAGWGGAVAAFVAFTLPSALLLIGFASFLPHLSGPVAASAIHGLKLVACAVVADAVLGMSKKLCPDQERRAIAVLAAAVLLMASSAWAQVGVVVAGGLAGGWFCRGASGLSDASMGVPVKPWLSPVLMVVFLGLLVGLPWLAQSDWGAVAEAFYRAGALVFGGGHVVLPLLEESVVGSGWMREEPFLAGYGAAQAIPGPMFAFSAYLGTLIPTAYPAELTALVALVFMFLPGFLLVAAVLPVWHSLAQRPRAASVVAGVNAAVVGILAAALYDPIFTSGIQSNVDMAIVAVAFGMLVVGRCSPLWVVLWCLLASMGAAAWLG